MFRIALLLVGLFSFVSGSGVLGTWLRRNPSKANAEKSSRILQFLFFAGLVAPSAVVWLPGLGQLDKLVGLRPLPNRRLSFILGAILMVPGFYLLGVSNKLLRALGSGANAFRLTKQVVLDDVYRYTRNPMSLGSYLIWLGTGLTSGSTFITLLALLGYIPAHLFALKYFEELELELRFGQEYLEYKEKVPFLLPSFPVDGKRKEDAMRIPLN